MQWLFSYKKEFLLSPSDSIRLPLNLVRDAVLVRTVADTRRPIGVLQQCAFIEGFGYVKSARFELREGFQLFRSAVPYSYRLDLEPIRSRVIELSIWVPSENLGATMPLLTGDAISWIDPILENGWANYGGSTPPAQYSKRGNQIFLRGVVHAGSVGSAIFTLQMGCRPASQLNFPVVSGDGSGDRIGRVTIQPDGSVLALSGATVFFSLDGVFFFV